MQIVCSKLDCNDYVSGIYDRQSSDVLKRNILRQKLRFDKGLQNKGLQNKDA